VPSDALGTMRLLAVGEVVRGRLESHEEFDEVLLTVEATAELQTIEFAVEKPWKMQQVGRRIVVPAIGQFSDGVWRPLSGSSTGSRFHSSDERVVSVDATGVLHVIGRGKAMKNPIARLSLKWLRNSTPDPASWYCSMVYEAGIRTAILCILNGNRFWVIA
jgi:hypothetical protein